MKNFGESGRGWQPRPIKEGSYFFLFSPMTNDICMKGFWPPEVEIASSNSKTVFPLLQKSLHKGSNVQQKFPEILMAANSQTSPLFLTTRDNGIIKRI
jgi:hypothetical protein